MKLDTGIRNFNPDEIRALTQKIGMRPEQSALKPKREFTTPKQYPSKFARKQFLREKIKKYSAELKILEGDNI